MGKQLVFIDDSGDPGLKSVSSNNFVMAAVFFTDKKIAEALSGKISDYRRSLGWRDDYEFKFTKIRKDIIVELLKKAVAYDFQIYAICIDKSRFRQIAPMIDKEKLYNWTIKELLTIIPIEDAKIEIDGRSSKRNMQKAATYFRREINREGRKKLEIRFEDSVDDNLIQFADLIAGSINRSMTEKTDSGIYINIIKSRIADIRKIS